MSKHVVHFICFVTALSAFVAGIAAGAQTPSGEIRGTVSDPSGALIPSAQVQLSGAGRNARTVTSGHDGSFQIGPVAPGKYVLVISAEGFATTTLENIEVAGGKTVQEKI